MIYFCIQSDLFDKVVIRLATIVPSVTLIRILKTLTYFESIEVGVHFSTWNQELFHFSVRDGIVYLVCQFSVMFLAGLYFDALNLSDLERRKSLLFCLRPSYWRNKKKIHE